MTIFRPARESDLAAIYNVFYENEIQGLSNPPSLPERPPAFLGHVLQTGMLAVAEDDHSVIAYAGSITRGAVTFLTDLFVLPGRQSSQVGKTLLKQVMPQDGRIHCTLSSDDPRAQALYIRSGMRPQWPSFGLVLTETLPTDFSTPAEVEISEAQVNDPALVTWDAQITGRLRPQEHAFWVSERHSIPLWFHRGREIVGYGYVRWHNESLWHAEVCVVGPIGVKKPENAEACVLAAIAWARRRANNVLRIDVPGPHPCLTALLNARFRIVYVDTFVSSASIPLFDARSCILSGADLF